MPTGVFRDTEAANRAGLRLAHILHSEKPPDLSHILAKSPDPDLALVNLERWIGATPNPGMHLAEVLGDPLFGGSMGLIFGASQPLADIMIQNPELASLLQDRTTNRIPPSIEAVIEEGRRLLRAAHSFSHSLDRLRYLRQRWILVIALNDLAGLWPEPQVWQAISDLAQGLVSLALEATWADFAQRRGLSGECPIMVVGFGKFGGRELNYSSDIDLAYITLDDLDPGIESEMARFCESLGRAISDPMGRGFLYRVDLRLRPFGAAGPIFRSMAAYESYYRLYAEPWEVQALLKSRSVAGPEYLAARWGAMREATCFKPAISEMTVDAMLAMRSRIETDSDPGDIKRGSGGIRDVEFLTQILQIVHGADHSAIRERPTLDALGSLEPCGMLDSVSVHGLSGAYTFLRQLEHRIQLTGDQQTHRIPTDPHARLVLARSMGEANWPALQRQIQTHRRTIVSLYQSTLHVSEEPATSTRGATLARFGSHAVLASQWFDSFEASEGYFDSLSANQDSADRVEAILARAPSLIPYFKSNISLTDALLSGEIEEPARADSVAGRFEKASDLRDVGRAAASEWVGVVAQWVLADPTPFPSEPLTRIADRLLVRVQDLSEGSFDIIALGSYGSSDLSVGSDCDLLFLSPGENHATDEARAQDFLAAVSQLRRFGSPFHVDLRLRPEGKQGLLVRSEAGFSAYELNAMEMWERFALGEARLVAGRQDALDLVRKAAYAQPITPETLKELVAMKRRIETERLNPQNLRRDVKLGTGGLSDIEWLVHLLEMRFPGATRAHQMRTFPARISELARAQLLNTIEAEEIAAAHSHLISVRARLSLLGIPGDIIPENPAKLDRLAQSAGFTDGNAFLTQHQHVTDRVRAIYLETLERLRA